VTNYVPLNPSSYYLNYSFIYGNAMFIGLDVPGDVDLLTSEQLAFLDARLTYAESWGLVHAFIYFHGPLYCVESLHCDCSLRTDGSCTPAVLVSILNKHPIVSATFHGHEHILGWVHMDNTRVAGLTGSFEEFITSPSGGDTYNSYLYPARMDYTCMNMGESQAFAAISVNGTSFTVNFYEVGSSTPVWTKTFTKGTPVGSVGLQNYYMVDEVNNNGNFATLAAWDIDTAMVDFDVNGSPTEWNTVINLLKLPNIMSPL
jgi:hypothetical protein